VPHTATPLRGGGGGGGGKRTIIKKFGLDDQGGGACATDKTPPPFPRSKTKTHGVDSTSTLYSGTRNGVVWGSYLPLWPEGSWGGRKRLGPGRNEAKACLAFPCSRLGKGSTRLKECFCRGSKGLRTQLSVVLKYKKNPPPNRTEKKEVCRHHRTGQTGWVERGRHIESVPADGTD